MKVFKLLCFLFLLLPATLSAQVFYVSSPSNNYNITLGSSIYRVTVTPGGLVSELISTCMPGDQFFSIAMNKTGFYWIGGNGAIYKGDIVGNTLNNCHFVTNIPVYSNALTMGSDGKLYYSTGTLYSTDPQTGESKMLGNSGYSPSGDLTFYNGELYEAGTGLDKINVNNPAASNIYMPLDGYYNIFGLVSVSTSLHKNTVYALELNNNATDVLEIDVEHKTIVGKIGTLPYTILDAASPVEDGSIAGVKITNVNVHQDCSKPTHGIIEVTTMPNVETFTYKLNNGMVNNTGMFQDIAPGNYQLTVTSSNDSETKMVTVPAYNLNKPVYTYNVEHQVCDAPGAVKFLSANTGYKLMFNATIYPLNQSISGLIKGTYHFDILNDQGCKVDAVDVEVPRDKCTIQFDKATVTQQCDAIHKGVVQAVAKPHTDQYTYTLNGVSNSTGSFNNLLPGNYQLSITSPEDALNVPFTVPDYKLTQPQIKALPTDQSCLVKGSIAFTIAASSNQYQIQYNGSNYAFDHIFSDLAPGNYHFLVLTQAGCMVDEYDVKVGYQACPININTLEINPECNVLGKGLVQVKVDGIAGISYTYTCNNNQVNNTGIFNMLDPGNYLLTVNSSDGGAPQKRTVVVPDYTLNKPASIFDKTNPVCDLAGDIKITIPASGYTIRYNGGSYSSGHIFTGLYEGQYHFTILKSDGCIADEYDIELIREECSPVSFPSAFTPNGDGINDMFRADPKSKATDFKLQIYDRWGAQVFASNDLHESWDGTYRGRSVPVGVYYYFATFTTQEHKPAMLKGYITLMK